MGWFILWVEEWLGSSFLCGWREAAQEVWGGAHAGAEWGAETEGPGEQVRMANTRVCERPGRAGS